MPTSSRLVRLVGLALMVSVSACATVLGSKQKDFSFASTPGEADVFIDGNRVGSTPLKMNMSNTKAYDVTFKKAGYKDVTCRLDKGTGGGWVVFDVLTGLVPVVIDAATGNWSQTKGKGCDVQMTTVG